MSAHSSRLLVFAVTTVRCQSCGAQPLRLAPLARAYSIDSPTLTGGSQKPQAIQKLEKLSNSHSLTHRNLSAVASSLKGQCRPLSRFDFLDVGAVEENIKKALTCRVLRRFIVNPDIASLIADHLDSDLSENRAVIFECNPGPGVLTRTLLNAGAQRVVALESEKTFLPDLQALESSLDGQLEVVHCDFFKLDPIGKGPMKPPAMYTEKLFNDLGITEVPWTADVPVKVIGIFSQRNERNMLWKLVYALYERLSVFRYGRVELVMFISEKEYTKLTANPGDLRQYQALGVLWQMACDIQLLHKEPWSSFVTTSKHGGPAIPRSMLPFAFPCLEQFTNDHLCLVRMTPRRDLFTDSLTTSNSATLVMMIKQCLAKRKAKLVDRLNSWSPGSGQKLLKQLELPEDIFTGHVYPEEYKQLFLAMEHSEEFLQSWLYEEILENTQNTGFQ
ncbi:dimethyladenosine transferase 2, mitochondrial isoform X1 [Acipenser ruthenus]|uniref:dimethyladenosine transferase 2, mitochondrial isoform X1 n=1 Tax=Acipenser ruthenus TaxID=7906 RepID=UPI0027408167|nr:dimethyladenosine transferase 2, mitochondrial isoform X1 [Acipenser ruthenus]XP_058881899.1 dimethyladenosine transferase 2, mitochondrial isoform X1 [Acipenser ruthenus]